MKRTIIWWLLGGLIFGTISLVILYPEIERRIQAKKDAKRQDKFVHKWEEMSSVGLKTGTEKINSPARKYAQTKYFHIAVRLANIRHIPSTKGRIICKLKKDTKIEVIGEKNRWYKILLHNNKMGWIRTDLVLSTVAEIDNRFIFPYLGLTEQEILSCVGCPDRVYEKGGWVDIGDEDKQYIYSPLPGIRWGVYNFTFKNGKVNWYYHIYGNPFVQRASSFPLLSQEIPVDLLNSKCEKFKELVYPHPNSNKAKVCWKRGNEILLAKCFIKIKDYDPDKGYYTRNLHIKEYRVYELVVTTKKVWKLWVGELGLEEYLPQE